MPVDYEEAKRFWDQFPIGLFPEGLLPGPPSPADGSGALTIKAVADSGEVRMVSSTGAEKGSKLERFDLIPVGPLRELAKHFGRGAMKYDDNNWRKGYDWSLSFAALMRHAWAFWGGEDIDEETGTPHIIAAAWHCFALAEYREAHPEFDNRYRTGEQAGA